MSDKQLDKDVKIYIKEVKSLLICDYKTQKKFIGDIKSRIDEHIESGCVKNIDDIYKQIGTPQDIAKAFFENADVKKVKKKMNITRIILIGIIAALLMLAGTLIIEIIDGHSSNNGYFVDEMVDGIDNDETIDGTIGDGN